MVLHILWMTIVFVLPVVLPLDLQSSPLLNVVTPADCTIVRNFVDQQKLVVNEAATSGETNG